MGKLRESLTNPASSDDWSDIKLLHALDRARVTHLGSQLERYEHWDQTLSASERQKLANAFIQRERKTKSKCNYSARIEPSFTSVRI